MAVGSKEGSRNSGSRPAPPSGRAASYLLPLVPL